MCKDHEIFCWKNDRYVIKITANKSGGAKLGAAGKTDGLFIAQIMMLAAYGALPWRLQNMPVTF